MRIHISSEYNLLPIHARKAHANYTNKRARVIVYYYFYTKNYLRIKISTATATLPERKKPNISSHHSLFSCDVCCVLLLLS